MIVHLPPSSPYQPPGRTLQLWGHCPPWAFPLHLQLPLLPHPCSVVSLRALLLLHALPRPPHLPLQPSLSPSLTSPISISGPEFFWSFWPGQLAFPWVSPGACTSAGLKWSHHLLLHPDLPPVFQSSKTTWGGGGATRGTSFPPFLSSFYL